MTTTTIAIVLLPALLTIVACDGGLESEVFSTRSLLDPSAPPLIDLTCRQRSSPYCWARWDGSDAWSKVWRESVVLNFEPVDPSTLWACEPDPIVDGCGIVDSLGHKGCWLWEELNGELFARIVVPPCARVGDPQTNWPAWSCDSGYTIGVDAECSNSRCWIDSDATTDIVPWCGV